MAVLVVLVLVYHYPYHHSGSDSWWHNDDDDDDDDDDHHNTHTNPSRFYSTRHGQCLDGYSRDAWQNDANVVCRRERVIVESNPHIPPRHQSRDVRPRTMSNWSTIRDGPNKFVARLFVTNRQDSLGPTSVDRMFEAMHPPSPYPPE